MNYKIFFAVIAICLTVIIQPVQTQDTKEDSKGKSGLTPHLKIIDDGIKKLVNGLSERYKLYIEVDYNKSPVDSKAFYLLFGGDLSKDIPNTSRIKENISREDSTTKAMDPSSKQDSIARVQESTARLKDLNEILDSCKILNIFHGDFIKIAEDYYKSYQADEPTKLKELLESLPENVFMNPRTFFKWMSDYSVQARMNNNSTILDFDPDSVFKKGQRKNYRYPGLSFNIDFDSHLAYENYTFNQLQNQTANILVDVFVSYIETRKYLGDFRIDSIVPAQLEFIIPPRPKSPMYFSIAAGVSNSKIDPGIILPEYLSFKNIQNVYGGLNFLIESKAFPYSKFEPGVQFGADYSAYTLPVLLRDNIEHDNSVPPPGGREAWDNLEEYTLNREFSNVSQTIKYSEVVFKIGFFTNWYVTRSKNFALFGDFSICPTLPVGLDTELNGGTVTFSGDYVFKTPSNVLDYVTLKEGYGYGENKAISLIDLPKPTVTMGMSLQYGVGMRLRFSSSKSRYFGGFLRLGFMHSPLLHNLESETPRNPEDNLGLGMNYEITDFKSLFPQLGFRSTSLSFGISFRIN
jgi:hypothetical protein